MMKLILPLALLATPAVAQNTAESQLAKQVLEDLQAVSFQNEREYCGYLVINTEGTLVATPAAVGEESSCLPDDPPQDVVSGASKHTHGAFEYDTPAEFPSVGDMEGDEAEGIDGYVSTPGGRLWYIDSTDMIASQLCNIGCLSQDPNFEAGLDGDIKVSYSYDELLTLESM
jgi:hypothetical protein